MDATFQRFTVPSSTTETAHSQLTSIPLLVCGTHVLCHAPTRKDPTGRPSLSGHAVVSGRLSGFPSQFAAAPWEVNRSPVPHAASFA